MSTKKQLSKIARQKQDIRNQVWPDLDKNRLWWGDKDRPGWLLIPRTMPLLTRIMDMLAPKGKPVSQTYLDLWCRTYDDSFVIVSKPREMAYYSGFSGERAERTWATRMRLLQQLGFIDIKAGTNGPIHYVLVWNPYHVVKGCYEKGLVQEGAFQRAERGVIEIGAEDPTRSLKMTRHGSLRLPKSGRFAGAGAQQRAPMGSVSDFAARYNEPN